MTGPSRFGGGEELANVIEESGVGRQIGARRASDGLLIHTHQALDGFHAGNDFAADGDGFAALQFFHFVLVGGNGVAQMLCHQFDQRLTY